MPDAKLKIIVGGSALMADFHNLQPWRALLDSADAIAIQTGPAERLRVDLSGLRRWIAFSKSLNGSPLYCIGWQETVGAIHRNGSIIGGSNRKTMAWLHPSGRVVIGDSYGSNH